jgi:hypothetical protein
MKHILEKFGIKKPQDSYPTFTDTNEPMTSTSTNADPSVLASAATAQVVQAASATVSC